MNCYQHPDASAVAYCRSCGRAVCDECQRTANGTVFCPEHAPLGNYSTPRADSGPNPYIQPVKPIETSPGLAFLLGLIPGVGAIYNAQYLKGFIHVAILGVLISILSSGRIGSNEALAPFFGLLIGIWYFYMPFEAYHTARKRQLGVAVDEWSSLLPKNSMSGGNRLPLGPVILIGIGVLFLLDNLGILPLGEVLRYWPLILIGIGVYSLYSRLSGPVSMPPPQAPPPPQSSSEAMGVSNEH
ncbi:MAG TPA: B-box zinc finger protein [Bryobacteraceae bacterium]|jgi:hypothetical protein